MIRAQTRRRARHWVACRTPVDWIGVALMACAIAGLAWHGPTFARNTACHLWPDGHCYAREDARRP